MLNKEEKLHEITSELLEVQKRLKKIKKTSTKIQALREEDELIQQLMRVENDEVIDEVIEKETFDMNEIEFMK